MKPITETKIEFTEAELEARFKNKFAEGAAKERKRLLEEMGITSVEEAKAYKLKLTEAETKMLEYENQIKEATQKLTNYEAERLALKSGASQEMAENAVALVKGKGLEITEENIKKALEVLNSANPKGFGSLPKQQEGQEKKRIPKVF